MEKETADCGPVWDELARLRELGVNTKVLEDAFCDFECSWLEHATEAHT